MRSGVEIGRIFGIRIRVDLSWLLIFFLVTWNLATDLSSLHSGWSSVLRWAVAILGALLLFLSVLAHELAHSVVARARGIPVRSIRLHLFGGVSNLEKEPDSPGAEFVMAILGPLTSIVVGGVLLIMTGLVAGAELSSISSAQAYLSQLNPFATLAIWLSSVNLTLGLFNLIPGFPLDGGRVLRAVLWGISGNLRAATRWASWIGRGVAWLMIFAGVATTFGVQLPIIGQGLSNGLWLAFIGWFLHNAAVQSYRQMIIRDALEDVAVEEVMRQDYRIARADESIATFVETTLLQADEQGFPVLDGDELVGIVTLQDVRTTARDRWSETLVRDVMTHRDHLVTLSPDDDAISALNKLAQNDVRQLPVLSGEKLAGLVRRRDLVKWLQVQGNIA